MSYMNEIAEQHLGSLPPGWTTSRVKFVADIETSNVDKVANPDEIPIRLCNYTDVYYHDRITADLQLMEGTATRAEIEKFKLRAGQVLITKDSEGWDDIGIPALVVEDIPDAVCGYHLAIFTPHSGKLDGGYFAWLCRADSLNDQFKLSANGVTRFGLGQYAMKNAVIAIPPLKTQRRLAAYLDEKTAQIDALIEKKQQLLERLAEKRQAIITQAVTKGLNPSAPMKDSGIDWLGQIPVHWDVERFRFSITNIEQGWSPQCEARAADLDEWGVLKVGCVNGHEYNERENKALPPGVEPERQYEVSVGDVLISRANTQELLGSAAVVHATKGRILLCDKLYRIKLTKQVDPAFLLGFLRSPLARLQYERDSSGTSGSMQNIRQETISNLLHPLPPLDEQIAIANSFRTESLKSDVSAKTIECTIERLNEYRSALITAAVTGQIEELR